MKRPLILFLTVVFLAPAFLSAAILHLPTPNSAIFRPGSEEKYFVGTIGRPWTSGTFGCVRSSGGQLHEGIDIRCTARDKRGEASDPVMAAAPGSVAYINYKSSLSNYGIYIVLRHHLDGLEIYSTYAHLAQVRSGLKIGQSVKAGEMIGVMGRSTNTREGISKERAHLHFELNFFVNEDFNSWFKKRSPGQRNDHGIWNGQNMIGIDPRAVLLASHRAGEKFNLLEWVRDQKELCRVLVRAQNFPWLKRYSALVKKVPAGEIAGYELVLNFNGLPFEIIPRTAAEIKRRDKFQLLSVNSEEARKNPCRDLVLLRKGKWELGTAAVNLLELLTR